MSSFSLSFLWGPRSSLLDIISAVGWSFALFEILPASLRGPSPFFGCSDCVCFLSVYSLISPLRASTKDFFGCGVKSSTDCSLFLFLSLFCVNFLFLCSFRFLLTVLASLSALFLSSFQFCVSVSLDGLSLMFFRYVVTSFRVDSSFCFYSLMIFE